MFPWFPPAKPQLISTWFWINRFKSIFPLVHLLVGLSPKTDRRGFWRQLQKQFSRTWAAHYQWSSIPPPSLGCWQSPSVFIYPLSMSLHHPAHAPATHPHQPTPVTFCSALLQQDLFSSLSCQEMAEAHLIEPRGDVLLFNAWSRILTLSCVRISKRRGVSPVAVGTAWCWERLTVGGVGGVRMSFI